MKEWERLQWGSSWETLPPDHVKKRQKITSWRDVNRGRKNLGKKEKGTAVGGGEGPAEKRWACTKRQAGWH